MEVVDDDWQHYPTRHMRPLLLLAGALAACSTPTPPGAVPFDPSAAYELTNGPVGSLRYAQVSLGIHGDPQGHVTLRLIGSEVTEHRGTFTVEGDSLLRMTGEDGERTCRIARGLEFTCGDERYRRWGRR